MKIISYFFVFILLSIFTSGQADVVDTRGLIRFDRNSDGQSDMRLDSSGLKIGTGIPSANLDVSGNALITDQLTIGSSELGSANLAVTGSFSQSISTFTSNTIIQDSHSSIILADSSTQDLWIDLPYAGNVNGRIYTIKKTSDNNLVYVSGGGNSLDLKGTIELDSNNSLPYVNVISDGQQWHILEADGDQLIAADNLVGRWNFEETSGTTAVDDANGFDATLNNADFSGNSVIAKIGRGFQFSNSDTRYFSTADRNEFDLTTYTVTAWVKLPDETFNQTIYSKTTLGDGSFWLFKRRTGLDRALSIQTFGPVTNHAVNGDVIPDNEWHFVTLVSEGSTATLYQNGELTNGPGTINTYIDNAAPVQFGAMNGTSNVSNGIIDDLRLYNRALSSDEIKILYRSGLPD